MHKAAAGAPRPASVSSLATALAVLCAFTATKGNSARSHGAVVNEAFACLMCLAESVTESSAGAECVKAALVSLKECVEVRNGGGVVSGGGELLAVGRRVAR